MYIHIELIALGMQEARLLERVMTNPPPTILVNCFKK